MSQSANYFSFPGQGACITIGNFDGAHLGHQSLVALMLKIAQENNLAPILVTFYPHPRTVLLGPQAHTPLSTFADRKKSLTTCGVKNIIEIEFTSELAAMEPEAFVKKYLLPFNLSHLVIGHDFTLGRQRQGSADRLRAIGAEYGFALTQAAAFELDGIPVSSTRLRGAISDGDIAKANMLLGHCYSLEGTIVHGFGRGKCLGFPTANLEGCATLIPANGVYATFAHIEGKIFHAVTNIGCNPTFGNTRQTVESFILDDSPDLYGKQLKLEFAARLRNERKFASADALKEQISLDVEKARKILTQLMPGQLSCRAANNGF